MRIGFHLTVVMLFEIVYINRITTATSSCGKSVTMLEAKDMENTLLSSDFTQSLTGAFKCSWIIYSSNLSHVIQIEMVHIFSGPKTSCSSEYILVRDGQSSTGQPLRAWCKGSPTGIVLTSYSNAIYVELVVSTYDISGLIFMMSYTASMTNQVITGPVELDVINFCLLAISIVIVLSIVIGIVILIKREFQRYTEAKKVKFKKMLRVRRKGISGISGVGNNDFRMDDSGSERSERDMEDTSFTVVSVTPTSEYDTLRDV